jgi:hypothetical protein
VDTATNYFKVGMYEVGRLACAVGCDWCILIWKEGDPGSLGNVAVRLAAAVRHCASMITYARRSTLPSRLLTTVSYRFVCWVCWAVTRSSFCEGSSNYDVDRNCKNAPPHIGGLQWTCLQTTRTLMIIGLSRKAVSVVNIAIRA